MLGRGTGQDQGPPPMAVAGASWAAPWNGTIQLEPGIGGPHRGWDQPARGNTGADALGLFRAARD